MTREITSGFSQLFKGLSCWARTLATSQSNPDSILVLYETASTLCYISKTDIELKRPGIVLCLGELTALVEQETDDISTDQNASLEDHHLQPIVKAVFNKLMKNILHNWISVMHIFQWKLHCKSTNFSPLTHRKDYLNVINCLLELKLPSYLSRQWVLRYETSVRSHYTWML